MSHRQDLGPLADIRHIVVLMMENRSFDHMLGYLQQPTGRWTSNGLTGTETNPGPTRAAAHGVRVPAGRHGVPPARRAAGREPRPLPRRRTASPSSSRAATTASSRASSQKPDPPAEPEGLPMGYFTAEHLPVYDYPGPHYCVCDAWHSSVPGDTWPNRLLLARRPGGRPVAHRLAWLRAVPAGDRGRSLRTSRSTTSRLHAPPPATTSGAGTRTTRPPCAPPTATTATRVHLDRGNFAYFNRGTITARAAGRGPAVRLRGRASSTTREPESCATCRGSTRTSSTCASSTRRRTTTTRRPTSRPGSSWCSTSTTRCPSSPEWNDTLLVITYDEHGGFYDHVVPPPVPSRRRPGYATYGVRVPALVIGPRVRAHVCHELFDHTSLITTILRRFAPDPATGDRWDGAAGRPSRRPAGCARNRAA